MCNGWKGDPPAKKLAVWLGTSSFDRRLVRHRHAYILRPGIDLFRQARIIPEVCPVDPSGRLPSPPMVLPLLEQCGVTRCVVRDVMCERDELNVDLI